MKLVSHHKLCTWLHSTCEFYQDSHTQNYSSLAGSRTSRQYVIINYVLHSCLGSRLHEVRSSALYISNTFGFKPDISLSHGLRYRDRFWCLSTGLSHAHPRRGLSWRMAKILLQKTSGKFWLLGILALVWFSSVLFSTWMLTVGAKRIPHWFSNCGVKISWPSELLTLVRMATYPSRKTNQNLLITRPSRSVEVSEHDLCLRVNRFLTNNTGFFL